MNRLAKSINRLFGLDEISERLFGEGPEAPEKRRMWCARMSWPALFASGVVFVAGVIFILWLDGREPKFILALFSVPTTILMVLASWIALAVCLEGLKCEAPRHEFLALVGFVLGSVIFLSEVAVVILQIAFLLSILGGTLQGSFPVR